MKFNHTFIVGAITLLALAACSPSKDSALPQSSPSGSPAKTADAMKEKPTETTPQNGFSALQDVVTQTKAAVKGGNFAKAKTEFDKFEASWSKIEDGVKVKSRTSYDNIEAGMDAVKSALKESKAGSTIDALDALNKTVVSVAK